jgi:hypothetical protein
MIKFLYPIVSLVTLVPIRAILMIFNVPALLRLVKTQRPAPILLVVMIVRALFEIVSRWLSGTRLSLKMVKV